jgi:tRNA threonylcarbamoyladenosine modification (KEOPS) complex  Pcc1 subunit
MEPARAEISIEFDDATQAEIAFKSLKPEMEDGPKDRGRESMELSGKTLQVMIEGDDRAAFRAGIYNYSRWLKLMNRLLEKE